MKTFQLIQRQQLRGAEVFASQLAAHLANLGHETVIVSLYAGEAQLPFNGRKKSIGAVARKRFFDFSAWRRLAKMIRQEDPDIIQANAGDTLKYAVFSKIFFGWRQPIVFRNASTISLYITNYRLKIWNKLFFLFAKKIISVSNASAADFKNVFPGFQHKVLPIPIGIENEVMNAWHTEKARVKYRDNYTNSNPVFIHVGGFTYEKNHEELISIFEGIVKSIPSANLYLVGDGPLRKNIENIIFKKGLSNKVKMFGFQKNVLPLISEADVLLLPSIIEGLPAVILEAFFCRTPVVAYNVGGISEIVISDETGYLIEKGRTNEFINAALQALQDVDKNKYLEENAYTLATTQYSNKKIAERFLGAYETLIG
ncbi:MAG TPA: glycosyltransferase [Chitinophagaceae bacterium]|nr:glycosyltransferase [Chitinophagaceae bacterium]